MCFHRRCDSQVSVNFWPNIISVCLPASPSAYLPVCMSVFLSVCICIYLSKKLQCEQTPYYGFVTNISIFLNIVLQEETNEWCLVFFPIIFCYFTHKHYYFYILIFEFIFESIFPDKDGFSMSVCRREVNGLLSPPKVTVMSHATYGTRYLIIICIRKTLSARNVCIWIVFDFCITKNAQEITTLILCDGYELHYSD